MKKLLALALLLLSGCAPSIDASDPDADVCSLFSESEVVSFIGEPYEDSKPNPYGLKSCYAQNRDRSLQWELNVDSGRTVAAGLRRVSTDSECRVYANRDTVAALCKKKDGTTILIEGIANYALPGMTMGPEDHGAIAELADKAMSRIQ